MYLFQIRVLVLQRQLPIQADLTINCLRFEASIECLRAVFESDGDVQYAPSYDPSANPQCHRIALHVSG